jgi:hypothetical protein
MFKFPSSCTSNEAREPFPLLLDVILGPSVFYDEEQYFKVTENYKDTKDYRYEHVGQSPCPPVLGNTFKAMDMII